MLKHQGILDIKQCYLNTVDSRKLELSVDQKNSSSYREFDFPRNGVKTMKITGLLS